MASLQLGLMLHAIVSSAAQILPETGGVPGPGVYALIDTRQYAVCQLLGADGQGGETMGGYGTLVKPLLKDGALTQYKCAGNGIKNLSGKDLTFEGFLCKIIDSQGVSHETTISKASLTAAGSETLVCSHMLSV